jgi:2-polyprenyl-3-methyl-5-hydroxy-6-metoxy-1,4-benzoquinol methylase
MVRSKCPFCSEQGVLFLCAKDYNRRISDEVFLYHKCLSCELIYLVNVPEDLSKYYPVDYYAIPKDKESLLANSAQDKYKIDIIQQFIRKGRLLEIGSAYGIFACLANQSGFDVNVIEMNKQCCDFIQNNLGIRAIHSDDPATALGSLLDYNVITLWQVLEHLSDPWMVLTAAAERLAPGGILVLNTPNPDAFQLRVLGRYWTHVDAPRHLELIPADLLVKHMARLGLRHVLLTIGDKSSIGFNSFGWAFSFKNFFAGSSAQMIAHLMGRILTKLLIPIERTEWRGSTYTAIFQREE